MLVVCLDDLDVVIGVQRGGDLARQFNQQVDPEAHVTGTDDRGMAGGGGNRGKVFIPHAGRADHMDCTRLCRQRGEFHGRLRRGEIDDRLPLGDGRNRIVTDQHTGIGTPDQGANVLADPVIARPFNRADQFGVAAVQNGLQQHPPHTARRTGDHNSR